MALRIRRGTDAQRTGKTFELGEIVWTTDSQQMWVGNGITAGGVPVVGSNVAGFGLTYNNVSHKIEVSGLTSDDITPGINNLYHTAELAVDAVGAALVAGNSTNVGITFTYAQTQDDAGRINATVALDGVGITDVVSDTSPQLGGDLDLNSNDITGTGNVNITGTITASTITPDLLTTTKLEISQNIIEVTNGALRVNNGNQNIAEFVSVNADGASANTPQFNLYSSRGTLTSPTNSQAGDFICALNFGGYHNGQYLQSATLITGYDLSADMSNSNPGTNLYLVTHNNNGGSSVASLDYRGLFSVPALKVADVNGSLPSPAEAGMIVLDGTTFKGYNGTSWVNLN